LFRIIALMSKNKKRWAFTGNYPFE
jgi:hypothetical protein